MRFVPKSRALWCGGATISLIACTFGAHRDIVLASEVSHVFHMARNMAGTALFLVDDEEDLQIRDPSSGAHLATYDLPTSWKIVDLAAHRYDDDQVIALHEDGTIRYWDSGFHIPFAISPPDERDRTYCAVDQGADGALYLATHGSTPGSIAQGRLWRYYSGIWTWVSLGNYDQCYRIAVDDTGSKLVYAARLLGSKIKRFTSGLEELETLSVDDADIEDLDVQNGQVVVGGNEVDDEVVGKLWLIDGETGEELDLVHSQTEKVFVVQRVVDEPSSAYEAVYGGWTGVDDGYTVQGVMLE